MVVRYVVGKFETVDASTFRRFLGHLAFNVPPWLFAQKEGLPATYGGPISRFETRGSRRPAFNFLGPKIQTWGTRPRDSWRFPDYILFFVEQKQTGRRCLMSFARSKGYQLLRHAKARLESGII